MYMAISLPTPRLLLREWRDDDRELFAGMPADPAVMEMLLPMNRAASNACITQMQVHCHKHGFCQWAVELRGEVSLIGTVGLNWVPHKTSFTPRSRWAGDLPVRIGAKVTRLKLLWL
jgi:RimJ/RimL family protein N-acetyltransferase